MVMDMTPPIFIATAISFVMVNLSPVAEGNNAARKIVKSVADVYLEGSESLDIYI